MPKRTKPYRDGLLAALQDPVQAAHYLNATLADSDEMFLTALRDVAEAHQMSRVATDAGIARESLYRMLSVSGNPTYNSLLGIMKAMGLKLKVDVLSSDSDDYQESNTQKDESCSNPKKQTEPLRVGTKVALNLSDWLKPSQLRFAAGDKSNDLFMRSAGLKASSVSTGQAFGLSGGPYQRLGNVRRHKRLHKKAEEKAA